MNRAKNNTSFITNLDMLYTIKMTEVESGADNSEPSLVRLTRKFCDKVQEFFKTSTPFLDKFLYSNYYF